MTAMLNASAKMMKAAMLYQPGEVHYEAVPLPQPGPGEIVIQVGAALTCGTDLKTYRRGHPVLIKEYPSPFGHECAGTVYTVGEDVAVFKPGDRVVVANSAPCGDCFFCQKNDFNLCENLNFLNGAYAGFLKIPARIVAKNTLPLPQPIGFEAAAFCEPLAVCLKGIEACRIQPGDRVAVLGLGPIGQLLVRLAKLEGAHVTGFARNPLKLGMAQTFGHADVVANLTQYASSEDIVKDLTPKGYGFDVVIEAIGQPHMWEMAIQLARRGGLVNLFGGCEGGTKIDLETRRLHYDDLTLVSPFHHTPRHFRQALELIASGQVDPTPLITHRLPMAQVVEALEQVAAGTALKIALKPDHDSAGYL